VHPEQETRIRNDVPLATLRLDATQAAMHLSHPSAGRHRLWGRPVSNDTHKLRRPPQPAPGVVSEIRVLRDAGHGKWVQRLHEQRPETTEPEDRLGMNPPGHGVGSEDARVDRWCI
jgi:hypothetical protein